LLGHRHRQVLLRSALLGKAASLRLEVQLQLMAKNRCCCSVTLSYLLSTAPWSSPRLEPSCFCEKLKHDLF
jgi:hypothetical protein